MSEALRLADALRRCDSVDFDGDFAKAAAELRRLHARSEEQERLLRDGLEKMQRYRNETPLGHQPYMLAESAGDWIDAVVNIIGDMT